MLVIISDFAISSVFTAFGYLSPRSLTSSPDCFSPGGAHRVGTRSNTVITTCEYYNNATLHYGSLETEITSAYFVIMDFPHLLLSRALCCVHSTTHSHAHCS